MQFHDEDEKALLEKFRQNGGECQAYSYRRIIGKYKGEGGRYVSEMPIPKREAAALARLLRSGHVELYYNRGPLRFYRLRETTAPQEEDTSGNAETDIPS